MRSPDARTFSNTILSVGALLCVGSLMLSYLGVSHVEPSRLQVFSAIAQPYEEFEVLSETTVMPPAETVQVLP